MENIEMEYIRTAESTSILAEQQYVLRYLQQQFRA